MWRDWVENGDSPGPGGYRESTGIPERWSLAGAEARSGFKLAIRVIILPGNRGLSQVCPGILPQRLATGVLTATI